VASSCSGDVLPFSAGSSASFSTGFLPQRDGTLTGGASMFSSGATSTVSSVVQFNRLPGIAVAFSFLM
jgi:hypothetical protein